MKRSALSMAIASSLFLMASANAQEAGSESQRVLEEVVVTGSRIVRDGYTAPSPVTMATTDDMLKIQPTNIPDALNKLPQFQLSSSPSKSLHNFANTASHGNLLNLRGIGSKRTMILFDGVRMPKTTYLGDVDVNVIPNMLVERTEIVTGGASAAYGSDAVAGVVNFILDKDYVGFKVSAQGGMSAEGDNEHSRFGFAGGLEFADGAGHFLVSGEKFDHDGMLRHEREVGAAGWIHVGGTANCSSPIPGACSPGGSANPYIKIPDGRINLATDRGLISAGPAGFPFLQHRFLPNGELTPFDRGTVYGNPVFASGGDGYSIPANTTTVAPNGTEQLFLRTEYEFTPSLSGHVQGSYSRSDINYSSLANSFTGTSPAYIYSGNPYLPADIQALLGPNDRLTVAHYLGDGPLPVSEEQTDFWMINAGLDGELGNGWGWKFNFSHGDSEHSVDQSGLYHWQRAYAALDAVRDGGGNIVCRSSLDPDPAIAAKFANCRPINILGQDPSIVTPAGYAYATGTSSYVADNTQTMFAFELTGSPVSVPAGEVDVALGGEWRQEELTLRSNADPALLDSPAELADHFAGVRGVPPGLLHFWLTNVGVADGDLDVTEFFAEVNVPLLANLPGIQQLDVNGAVRYTDYSTSGQVETWKLGATWRPVNAVLVRGTLSTDIRAPSLFDLFAGDQFSIRTTFDPVTNRQENINMISGGNSRLQPEEADTATFGVVLTPEELLPGFSVSVDYYSIELDNAIGTLTSQQIIDNCVQYGGSECSLISRPSPTEFPTSIRQAPANIAFLNTKGLDFDATYALPVGPGDLNLRLYANHLMEFETKQSLAAPVLKWDGIGAVASSISEGRPEWSGMLIAAYQLAGLGVTLAERYVGDMKLASPGAPSNFVDDNIDAEWYTDLTVNYGFDYQGGEFEVFGTVNNLFDNEPPILPGTTPGATYPTLIATYDYIGRAFTVGVRASF